MAENKKLLKGGEFLIRDTSFADVFIPEDFDEEQVMIAGTCRDYLESEVFPILDRIDSQEEGLMRSLLARAGELGLLGVSLPEVFGGFEQSFVTSMLASESMGSGYSFSVAYSAHTGIGSLPILYYGNDLQKNKYLPRLASGEWIAAYCLTEPNAGSDANAGKTHAVLSDNGTHYILNGQKMWITNGGFADVQTVFAKIDNDRVHSAFIVERNWDGVVINPEEKKMGIKGSSTVQVFYNDVRVPVENLLGKRGEGFRIALNILHMGRIKLGGTILGAAKRAITQSVNYANERKQFGKFIAEFGAIKYKLAEQVIRTWVTESSVYRVSRNIDEMTAVLMAQGMPREKATIEGIAQYAIEAAAMKVFGSEALNYVVDEAVQIFGGMGFSAETDIDRAYRDSRINRIFEGTNEINRLLVVDTTIKKALKSGFDVVRYASYIIRHLTGDPLPPNSFPDYFTEKWYYVRNFKKTALLVMGTLSEKFKRDFMAEQEILFNISDIIMMSYGAESTLLRVERIEKIKNHPESEVFRHILDVYIYDCASRIMMAARDAVNSFVEGPEREIMHRRIGFFTHVAPVNTVKARRTIADKLIADNRYRFP
ncbi:MAG: acyl-CoA dehydrogenase family protein [Bacteroidales bacterium]|nr:acyl-CoA dehydrogenase family protein [Bacteroidales bacterium]